MLKCVPRLISECLVITSRAWCYGWWPRSHVKSLSSHLLPSLVPEGPLRGQGIMVLAGGGEEHKSKRAMLVPDEEADTVSATREANP